MRKIQNPQRQTSMSDNKPSSHAASRAAQTDRENEFSDPAQVRRLRQVSEHYPTRVNLFRRVYNGQASPRECIKALCLECNGWDEIAIGNCTAKACPVHRHRP